MSSLIAFLQQLDEKTVSRCVKELRSAPMQTQERNLTLLERTGAAE
jgi:hypothetical protein